MTKLLAATLVVASLAPATPAAEPTAADFAMFGRRLDSVDARLARIEQALGIKDHPQALPQPKAVPAPAVAVVPFALTPRVSTTRTTAATSVGPSSDTRQVVTEVSTTTAVPLAVTYGSTPIRFQPSCVGGNCTAARPGVLGRLFGR